MSWVIANWLFLSLAFQPGDSLQSTLAFALLTLLREI